MLAQLHKFKTPRKCRNNVLVYITTPRLLWVKCLHVLNTIQKGSAFITTLRDTNLFSIESLKHIKHFIFFLIYGLAVLLNNAEIR